MKLTIDIQDHPHGTALYLDRDGETFHHCLIEPAASTDDIARLILEQVGLALQPTQPQDARWFLFQGELGGCAVLKSYSDETEQEMAEKIAQHAPEIGPVIKVTETNARAALALSILHPIVDGIDGRIS